MQAFATEFPIRIDGSTRDFLGVALEWILESPFTSFARDDLAPPADSGEFTIRRGIEQLDVIQAHTGDGSISSIRYVRRESDIEWTTTATCRNTAQSTWVNITIACESDRPAKDLPIPKKPVLVRTLLDRIGGGQDGALTLQDRAIVLENHDIDRAVRAISGRLRLRLPFVYLSVGRSDRVVVDADRLARRLAGMAHVIVEPNRAFSLRLKQDVAGQNVYGGTVGVYWPDAGGRRAFFPWDGFRSDRELEAAVFEEVRAALANRRPLPNCTWAAAKEAHAQATYQALRAKGSVALEEYVANFDEELKAKDVQIEDAEREIQRLHAEIRKYEARSSVRGGIQLATGDEVDLYPSELLDIVVEAIQAHVDQTVEDSRRRHVLDAVARSNKPSGAGHRMADELREALRGYQRMTPGARSVLERLGFELSESGKHIKAVFCDDDRYVFILPKTGSDHRGGLNTASDISKRLF